MTEVEKGGRSTDLEVARSVWEEARELVKRLEGSSVRHLLVEVGKLKIEIDRRADASAARPAVADGGPDLEASASSSDGSAETDSRHPILAPLLGTFYRSPEPGSPPFVEEGDVVDEGQTVAIVEAMKLMNQVTADRSGRVAEIAAADGQWVEFEQVLMRLEPIEE
jgi:acetyl-CoA carboxylase biotin carboxyl carrier protein